MGAVKRHTALLLVFIFMFLLGACGEDDSSSESSLSSPVYDAPSENSALEPLPLATGGVNPLTGLPAAEGYVDGQRPVAVMVSNEEAALPQRGLAAADVLFEMPTEGGVTRLMALYGDFRYVPQVGPVRSTRDQFVQFAYPANALLAHIGSSVYARNLTQALSYSTLDGYYLGTTTFTFDVARSLPKPGGKRNEHCWFTDTAMLWTGIETSGIPYVTENRMLFHFDSAEAPPANEARNVVVSYSDISYSSFVYDDALGLYAKTIFGALHTDEDGTPLTFQNVILLNCPITLKEDGYCTDFDLRGGTGFYFAKGGAQEITWQKGDPAAALHLFGPDGNELAVLPGKTFVGLVPADRENAVYYGPLDMAAPAAPVEEEPAASASTEPVAEEKGVTPPPASSDVASEPVPEEPVA